MSHHLPHAHLPHGNPLAPPSPPPAQLPPQLTLADLQWRVLKEAEHTDGQAVVTTTLHSAYRAQLATPGCTQR